jgi:transcription elongation factor Elf1
VNRLRTCPECGSNELHATKRVLDGYTEIDVTVCGVCHWASDVRVGRPPADRSKNVTLRRLMQDAKPAERVPPASDSPSDRDPA